MPDRLFWFVAFVAFAAAVGWLVKRRGSNHPLVTSGHQLLYFWGPHCGACTVAKETLAQLVQATPWLHLQSVNVIEHPDEGRKWSVRTIPTIILLDGAGKIAYRSSGALSPGQLQRAISALMDQPLLEQRSSR
jgi:thioredoxin-like negative regulator of GroEL